MTHPSAPGVKRRRRADGSTAWYWVATATSYEPRTVRLDYPDTPEGRLEMAAHARVLQAEMLDWLANGPRRAATAKPGTIAWVVDRYQTDEDSPYRDVRPSTRKSYDESLAIIRATVGERHIAAVAGPDIRRWWKNWGRADDAGVLANPRRAYGCVQLLRIAVAYGTSLRDRDCRDLKDVLSAMQFDQPGKRSSRMTFEQARVFRAKAHELGHHSLALAMALQFELGLRQRDVIGEWVEERWATGLTWSHIDGQMILRKPTSKSNGSQIAEHDLRRYPEVLAELALVPADRRVGPVVLCEATGAPYRRRQFSGLWRAIADAAGLPKGLWNMDSRAGAISEAYEAGAAPADVMKAATHTQIATSMRYNRGAIEQTSRVADLRAERRKRK